MKYPAAFKALELQFELMSQVSCTCGDSEDGDECDIHQCQELLFRLKDAFDKIPNPEDVRRAIEWAAERAIKSPESSATVIADEAEHNMYKGKK